MKNSINISQKIYRKILSSVDIIPYRILRLSDKINHRLFSQKHPSQDLINKLREIGCDSTSHMNRNLLEHFQGTYQLLKKWGNSESVCLAGLFHAIYGTETFPNALVTLEKRQEISSVIGEEAEKLVYYYSILTRKTFIGNLSECNNFHIKSRLNEETIPITELEFRQLVEIFLADRLEQIFSLNYRCRYQYKEFFLEAKSCLSQAGFQEFLIAYNCRA